MDRIGTRKVVRSGTNNDQRVRKIDIRLWYGVLCPLTQSIHYWFMRNGKKTLKLSATDTVHSSPFPRFDSYHNEPAALGFKFHASGNGFIGILGVIHFLELC